VRFLEAALVATGLLGAAFLVAELLEAAFLAAGFLEAAFLAGLRAGFLPGLPDAFAAALATRALRSEVAKAAGPNLSIFLGCMLGAIWTRARERTTPTAHSDISRAEPP
jgi:hypothetical protein